MNKCIKRLVESLFDDDFDDIVNHDDEVTTITRKIMKIELPYCESYLSEHSSQCRGRGKHVYSEIDQNTDTIAFYIKGDRNKKNYLVSVGFPSTNDFQKFIDELYSWDIKNVLLMYYISGGKRGCDMKEAINNIRDFKNINFVGGSLSGITPKNLYFDYNSIKKEKLFKRVFNNNYPYQDQGNIWFHSCWFDNETTVIKSIDEIKLWNCQNMNDYSFIKKINTSFNNYVYSYKELPKTGNLIGLPNGKYRIQLEFRDLDNINEPYQPLDGKVKINFVGLPSNCIVLEVRIGVESPEKILPYMSFEGITNEILPNFYFSVDGFSDKIKIPGVQIQLGPYRFKVRQNIWRPTQQQLEKIIKLKDWFLDCYTLEDGPHREYIKPDKKSVKHIV